MIAAWDPRAGHARAAGGLLAAAAGESRPGHPASTARSSGPVTTALVDLAHAYVARHGQGTPLDVAARLDHVPAPAWLLSVAVVRPYRANLTSDALRLANAAGVPGHALSHCVTYVELAAQLFGGRAPAAAIEDATGEPARRIASVLTLCGEPHLDGLTAGIWALMQSGSLDELIDEVARFTSPSVSAAAAGLLGLRDGSSAVPETWHHDVPDAPACLTLAADLVRVRHHAYLQPSQPQRPRSAERVTPTTARIAGDPPRVWGWSTRR